MKTYFFTLIYLFLLVEAPSQTTGGNPALVNFTAERVNDAVNIQWTIRNGFSCTSVYVMHSTDSVNFHPIHEFPGICGAAGQDESYSFLHTNHSPGSNYYKMELGSNGVSGIIPIYLILYGSDGLTIVTNSDGSHSAHYYNPNNTLFTIELFSETGKSIFRQTEISGDQVTIPNAGNGLKVVLITLTGADGTLYTGKYIQ